MPINKEDDYYASVKQDDNSTKPEKTTKKRVVNKKIIVRKKPTEEKSDDKKPTRTRKPYVKKQPDNKKGNLSEEKNTDKKTWNNKTSTTRKPRPNPKWKPNQKSNVSKVRREVVKNTKYKSAWTWNWSNAKPWVKREVWSNPNYRWNSQSRSSWDNSASGSSNSWNSGWFSWVKKVFTWKKSFPKWKSKPYISKKEEEDKGFTRSKKMQQEKRKKDHEKIEQILVSKKWQTVEIPEFISVKEYSDKIGIPLSKVIAECMKNWILANLNTPIDFDTWYIIWEAFDIIIIKAESNNVSTEAVIDWDLSSLIWEEDPDKSEKRSPIISVMWHVDHGKTSILDYIRKSTG